MKIDSFNGHYRFLSNFYSCPVMFEGVIYPSSENAFQAAKTLSDKERKEFQNITCSQAKKLGRKLDIRPDWKSIRDYIMYEIVLDKFLRNRDLHDSLINTGERHLVEGNTWNDKYWGVCKGEGENRLGKILMNIRATLQSICDVA